MAHTFQINGESLRRRFSVYAVVAQGDGKALVYVGKTGDNREGCNPIISRCGNHFSYNKIHSQVRNKIPAHESWTYTYIFDHFDDYIDDTDERRTRIDRINEMERWLNLMVQEAVRGSGTITLLNPFKASKRHAGVKAERRQGFRTEEAKHRLEGIVAELKRLVGLD